MIRASIFGAIFALAFTSSAFADTATLDVHSPVSVSSTPSFDLNSIVTATVADLQAADADAIAHNDTFADQCYKGAIVYVESNPVNLSLPPVIGVVTAFQAARDGVRTAESLKNNGIPPTLIQACGPLALSVQADLGQAAVGFTLFGLHF